MNARDKDLGSGGLVLLPTLSSGQQLLAQQNKLGTIVLLDRNNMGKYCVNQSPVCSGSEYRAGDHGCERRHLWLTGVLER